MRPTSPESEAARLYHAASHDRAADVRAEVYETRQTLRDDLLHATVNGYSTATPSAILTHFEAMMEADGYDLDARQAITDYGQVYLDGRAKYLHSVHPWPCERCTGKGQPPAEVGSPRKPSHEHAMAVRLVSKAILADLYNEAVSLRAGQPGIDAQAPNVGSEAQAVAS